MVYFVTAELSRCRLLNRVYLIKQDEHSDIFANPKIIVYSGRSYFVVVLLIAFTRETPGAESVVSYKTLQNTAVKDSSRTQNLGEEGSWVV